MSDIFILFGLILYYNIAYWRVWAGDDDGLSLQSPVRGRVSDITELGLQYVTAVSVNAG